MASSLNAPRASRFESGAIASPFGLANSPQYPQVLPWPILGRSEVVSGLGSVCRVAGVVMRSQQTTRPLHTTRPLGLGSGSVSAWSWSRPWVLVFERFIRLVIIHPELHHTGRQSQVEVVAPAQKLQRKRQRASVAAAPPATATANLPVTAAYSPHTGSDTPPRDTKRESRSGTGRELRRPVALAPELR